MAFAPSLSGSRVARLRFTLRLQPFFVQLVNPSCLDCLRSMITVKLTRNALRTVAWRIPACGKARFAPSSSSLLYIQRHHPNIRYRQIASTSKMASSSSYSTKKEEMEEGLRKMDINAAEKHMKDWFGDHASWSHEQLLKLIYGTMPSRISTLYTDRYQRRTL